MSDRYYHYGSTRCNRLVIKQVSVLFKEEGKTTPIRWYYYEDNVTIQIEQSDPIRITTITADNPMRACCIWDVFQYIDKFFMLCEGRFTEISEVLFFTDDEEKTEKLKCFSQICVDQRLNYYHSAGFCKYHINCWLNPVEFLNQELFDNWIDLLDELDIIHQVVLYSVSDVGITIDVKAMFLIESFEGLADLLKDEVPFRKAKKFESQLKIYLIAIINEFGKAVFQKEIACDIEKVTQVFVDSRNRIAHIKTKSKKTYLNGEESLVYSVKLYYLYRIVLMHLLGIDYSCCEQKIENAVKNWDEHEYIVARFLDRI